jgi:hypothetical protein
MAEESPQQGQSFPIELNVPGDAASQYVTNVVIQDTGGEFFLTFFKAEPPVLIGTPEQQEQLLAEGESPKVRADYLGRFVFSETRLSELIDVLSDTLQKHLALQNLKREPEEK